MLMHNNVSPDKSKSKVQQKAKILVDKLVDNDNSILQELLNIKIFSALFCKRNETLLKEMRMCFREKLRDLCDELNNSNASLLEKEKKLNKHICTLPLADIKTDQKYLIPTYNENTKKWQLITYKVTPIELTPTYGLGRLILIDNNRFFAYGFTPETTNDIENRPLSKLAAESEVQGDSERRTAVYKSVHEDSSTESTQQFASAVEFRKRSNPQGFNPNPHLVFINPEYPAQQGFLANLYLWFQSVSGFYKYCQPEIDHWLEVSTKIARSKAIVHAIGHASRLALETAFTESAQYIAKESISDAYNLPHSLVTNYKNKWDSQKNKPVISIQMHKNHYNLGKEILPEWFVYNSENQKIENDIFNDYFNTLVIYNVLSGLINTLLIMPCQYLIIPAIRTILNHKTELALLCVLTMVYVMLPGLISTDIGTTLAIFAAVYFGIKLIEPLKVLFKVHENPEAECHVTHHAEENIAEEFITKTLK